MCITAKRFIFVVFLISVPFLTVEHARAQTLKEAVAEAMDNHPRLLSARLGAERYGGEVEEQESSFFPKLSVSGQGGRMFANNSTSRGATTTRDEAYSYIFEGSFKARQMIFDGFEASNRVDAAVARQKSAELTIEDVAENLALSTAQAYVDVLRARRGYGMLEAHEDVVRSYYNRISSAVEQGAADEAELQKASEIQVILDGLILDYAGQIKVAEANFAEVTGRMPEDLYEPVARLEDAPMDLDEAVRLAVEGHPSVQAAAEEARSAVYEADAEEGSLWPDFDGELSYLKRDQREEIGGELEDARAVFRLNWEYDVGGAQKSRIRQKRLMHKEAMARMNELERSVERTVRQAYAEYETAASLYDNQKIRHVVNRELFETYEVQFEGARISLVQLMQSDNQLFTTRLEKMNGAHRLLAAQFGVLASLGQLQESLDLTSIHANLDGP